MIPILTDRPAQRGPHVPRARGMSRALASLACAAAVSCTPPTEATSDFEAAAEEAKPTFEGLERAVATKVLTSPLVQREMVRELETTVNAASETEIDVFPRTTGVVVALHAEEGDRVDQGATLLEIDPREFEAALSEAKIALREAENALQDLELTVDETRARTASAKLTYEQSQRELARKEDAANVISRNELDLLRLAVATNEAELSALRIAEKKATAAIQTQEIAIERAELQITRAELDLSFTNVEAPFAGVIARRDVQVGDLVSNASAIFVLTDPENVRAVVSRPQRELTFFRDAEARARKASDHELAGASALDIEIEPEALPGATYTGRIRFVSPTVDPASGQFRVTIGIDQPEESDGRLPVLPGMLLRIRIVTERHPGALVVPKRALLREGDSYFVFAAEDGVARRVRVDEGFTENDFVEVVPAEGMTLAPDDEIVVVGNRDLEDGDRVDPSPWAGSSSSDDGEDADGSEGDDDA